MGLKGGRVKLETALLGGVRVTSAEAVARISVSLDEHAVMEPGTAAVPVRTGLKRRHASEAAAARLVSSGF